MNADPPFVFICYPREVEAVVASLSGSLKRRMVATWYDTDITPGSRWPKVLKERLRDCGALVVMVAPGIADLSWLRREIGMARALGRPIFPVVLPGAGRPEMEALGVEKIQALRLVVEAEPPESWVRLVHDALYSAPVTAPPPVPVRPDRRSVAIAAAVAGVAGLVIGGLGGRLIHAPATPAAAVGACSGKAARIDSVSTVSPGHTGYTPSISVTVCAAAGRGHFYWLMDYTAGSIGRRFYAKAMVEGSAGTHSYRIVHDRGTGVASTRTYLVLDVPPEMEAAVSQQWISTDGAPLVPPGTDLPAGVTLISNEAPAVL
jgi:hypothetical protein